MHKRLFLLTKAQDKEEAINNVHDFMKIYRNQVFDWYRIGGRWHNCLAPKNKVEKFTRWVKREFSGAFDEIGYKVQELEKPIARKKIQKKWEDMGLKGLNVFYSAFGFDIDDEVDNYNVLPLNQCLETVVDCLRDLDKEEKTLWDGIIKEKEKETKSDRYTLGWYTNMYSDILLNHFTFDTNVFDITECKQEVIPKNIDGYWVVVVDMHM